MSVIDCWGIASEFCETIRERLEIVKESGAVPCINFIVGDSEAEDRKFIYDKSEFAVQMGVTSFVHKLSERATIQEATELIERLNKDNSIHAISLQPHLPRKLSFRNLVNVIDVDKDVEGLTTLNQGRLFSGEPGIIPCAPLGIFHLLRCVHEKIEGMHAVIIGRSSVVGRPLAQLLLNSNCTVTSLHSYSRDLPTICRSADILISAVGEPHFISGEYVKSGATVIDVGMNRIYRDGDHVLIGDVEFDEVKDIAGAITPVGGVEPMMLAYLVHNTLKLACCY